MKWIRNALVTLLRVAIREEIEAARQADRALARELASVLEMHDKFVRREASRRARAAQASIGEGGGGPTADAAPPPTDIKQVLRARLISGGRAAIIAGGVHAQRAADTGHDSGRGDRESAG